LPAVAGEPPTSHHDRPQGGGYRKNAAARLILQLLGTNVYVKGRIAAGTRHGGQAQVASTEENFV